MLAGGAVDNAWHVYRRRLSKHPGRGLVVLEHLGTLLDSLDKLQVMVLYA